MSGRKSERRMRRSVAVSIPIASFGPQRPVRTASLTTGCETPAARAALGCEPKLAMKSAINDLTRSDMGQL